MIRVLICDDHLIVRQGIRQMLAEDSEIEVIGEASDGPQALAWVRELASKKTLDVLLLDIAMPMRDGLDVLKAIKAEYPKTAVLMLSTYPDRQYAVRCLKLGASGYLNKSADSEQMITAIRKVATGGLFITPTVAEQLAGAIGGGTRKPAHETLSHREYQVFLLLAAGRSVGEIAASLALSSNTVSTYRARILEKTGTRNDVEIALYAVRQDLRAA